jgi:hypothetical protein
MVVACAALVVALGGTAVAAVVALPDGSVGTPQLANDAVVSAKIRDGSITSYDIANSTIRGADVRDHTLTRADFSKGALLPGPNGPLGPQGPPGSKGAPGTSGRQVVEAETALTSGNPKGITVLCPPGKKALSGGADAVGEGRDRISITASVPAGDSGWQARAVELVATSANWQLRVYAVCAYVAS